MALSIVQQASNVLGSNGVGPLTVTLGVGSTAGNTLIASAGAGSGASIITPPSGWQTAIFFPDTSRPVAIFYLPNCPAGQTTFAFTQSASTSLAVRVLEVAGIVTTVNPLDQKTLLTGSSATAVTAITPPTGMASEFCIAAFNNNPATASAPTNGYTLQGTDTSVSNNALTTSTLIQSVAANQFTGITLSVSSHYASVIATFYATPGPTTPQPLYYIKARSNSTLLTVDAAIENDFEGLTLTKRFNDVGTWALQLRRESSHYKTFLPVAVGGVPGFPNGILVQLDNQDGQGLQTVFSGPQTDIDVKSQQDSTQPVVVTGVSDEYWLSKRRALQTPDFPYERWMSNAASSLFFTNFYGYGIGVSPVRYYELGEPSGTVATDFMGLGNGTYTGAVTLAQPGLIDHPTTCTKFSATGYVSVPTAGLNGANLAWTVAGWGMLTSTPASNVYMWGFGTNAAKQEMLLGVTAAGVPIITGNGLVAITGATVIPLNTPFLLAATYDGTTVRGYAFWQDAVAPGLFGSNAPGVLAITYGACTFSGQHTIGNMWPAFLAHGAFFNGTVSAPDLALMFAIGYSRQAYTNYSQEPAGVATRNVPASASTLIFTMVQKNASATALPSTAFTNVYGTQTARVVPELSLAADPHVGSNLIILARQDNLLDLIAAIALKSTTELGFKLEQVGSQLVFTIYQPTDLTTTAIFSRDLYGATGNILDYEWKFSAATANHIIAGGANPVAGSTNLIDRLFGVGENASSISANGYLEDFLDYRQGTNSILVSQAISAQIAKAASIYSVQATMIDQRGVLYFKGPSGKGYDLGNKVTVLVDGQTVQQLIRQVQIDLQPGAPAVVTPAVGTPSNTTVFSEYDTIAQRLQALGFSTSNLNSNY